MRFIHAADLHLDSPFKGIKDDDNAPQKLWEELHQAPFTSFKRIVDAAIADDVDFVLLVGDLFDASSQSVEAISFLTNQLQRLDDHNIPVLLSFGNHDYQPEGSKNFSFPKNVYVFPSEVTTHELTLRNGKTVAVTGFSYNKRWIHDDVVADFPKWGDADYQIGMIHGAEKTGDDSNYAPFTVEELKNLGYDYWALGHIHKREELCEQPMVEYPGDIQGRHKNETGEKGYLLVSDDDGNLKVEFKATSPIVWSQLNLKIDSEMNDRQASEMILDSIEQANFKELNLVQVFLKIEDVNHNLSTANVLNLVQASLKFNFQKMGAWVYEIDVEEKINTEFSSLDQNYWDNTRGEVFNQENVEKLAKKLFTRPFIKENFDSEEELQQLVNQSINLIAKATGRSESDED